MKRIHILTACLLVSVAGCCPLGFFDGLGFNGRSVLLVRIEGSTIARPGEIIDLTAVATGGAGGYTYAWTLSAISVGALTNTTGATPQFSSDNLGLSEITVTVTDSLGQTNTANLNIQVIPPD